MANGGATSPGGAGPLVASGSKVVLVVSQGPAETPRSGAVATPNVVGKAQGEALSHLQAAGLNAQIVNDYSASVKRGHMIDQFPEAGQMQALNAEVVLLVSSGPATETLQTALPDVVGLSEQVATQRVSSSGLTAEVVHQAHPNVANGLVFAQLPSQSSVASPGKKSTPLLWVWVAIAVVVLLGIGVFAFANLNKDKTLTVPNVVGMTQEQAKQTLTSAGLKLGTVGAKETKEAKVGTVVTQSPAAGAAAQTGGAVQIELAVKQAPVPVPNVVGMSSSRAEVALAKATLVPEQKSENSPSVAKGDVISQKPSAGDEVETGSTVTIIISNGPPVTNTVTVPDLVGMTKNAAVDKANAVGLSSKILSDYDSSVPTGSVSAQSPDAGVNVASGSTVKLTISLGPTP